MHDQNARPASYFLGVWPGQNPGAFRRELPRPTEWDQLLAKLGLNDSQALGAIKSGGKEGEQLRNFVLKFSRESFVPEAVIRAVVRYRKENQPSVSLVEATTSGEQV